MTRDQAALSVATVVSEMIGVTVVREATGEIVVREATVVIEVTGATVEVVVAAEVAGEAEEEAPRVAEEEAPRVAEGLEKETRIPKSQQQPRKPKLMPEKKITGTVSWLIFTFIQFQTSKVFMHRDLRV